MSESMATTGLFDDVLQLIESGQVSESIELVARKSLEVLNEITQSHKSEIISNERWVKMYKTRQKTLTQKGKDFGGFEETLSLMSENKNAVDLILLESTLYVSMFLVDRKSSELTGAIYIERGKETM